MILEWQKFKGEERDAAFERLEEWVWWLRSTYPEAREAVVDCWPAHANLVNDLTALCVWWGEIYNPRAEEVPDPDDDSLPLDVSADPKGRIAVMWHGELQNAVKRWRANSKCTPSECVLDRQNGDLVADWRKRHARTRSYLDKAKAVRPAELGEGCPCPRRGGLIEGRSLKRLPSGSAGSEI
jgi:hypothetical protein